MNVGGSGQKLNRSGNLFGEIAILINLADIIMPFPIIVTISFVNVSHEYSKMYFWRAE